MAHYKLVSQNRHDSTVDEVIFNSPDNDERKTVSATTAAELSDADIGYLREQGYNVVESQAPEAENQQPVAQDVAGMSPVIGESGSGQPAISQTGMQAIQQSRPAQSGQIDQPQHEESDAS